MLRALDSAEIPCISNNVSNVDEVDIHPPLTLPNMRLGLDRIISAFSPSHLSDQSGVVIFLFS